MTQQELIHRVGKAASAVKLICGVANNAAWFVALDAYDHARQCRGYKHQVKAAFRQAIDEFHAYENKLLYAKENRMFHVDDFGDELRKVYGNITDREYYDFWASTGGMAYEQTRPLITSLWNKHRLTLANHGVKDADHMAWVLTAEAAIELADMLYEKVIKNCVTEYRLPRQLLDRAFCQFSVKRVHQAWRRALKLLAPDSNIQLETVERKNISHGLTQLCEAWINPELLYNSIMESVGEYDDIFRTKGYQKKVLREISETRDKTMDELFKNDQ